MRAIICILCLASLTAFSQLPDTLWTRHFGSNMDEYCSALLPAEDGSTVIAGCVSDWPSVPDDVLILKVSDTGELIWEHSYGGEGYDGCTDAVKLGDGGFALAGSSSSFSNGAGDFWLLRTDENGDSLWSKHYGGLLNEWCYALSATTDGGFVLAGIDEAYRILVIRTNSAGDSLWSYVREDSVEWIVEDVIETPDEGFLVFGSEYGAIEDAVGPFFGLIKLNAQGTFEWHRRYVFWPIGGGLPFAAAEAMTRTQDGGFILAGRQLFYNHGELMLWDESLLVKIDDAGELEWYTLCGIAQNDQANAVLQTPDGGYFTAGQRNQHNFPSDIFLTRTNTEGDTLWTKIIGGDSAESATSLVWTADSLLLVGGHSRAFGQGDYDIWIIKLDTTSLDAREYPAIEIPNEFRLVGIYPNPFNPTTTIEFDLPVTTEVSFQVYDVQGRLVRELLNENVTAGSHKVEFNGEGYPSGLYFARMQTGAQTMTRKMLLIK
jgi:hypothetical protein